MGCCNWLSLAASILILSHRNALAAANSSLEFSFPFDMETAKAFYLSDRVHLRESHNSSANKINLCFEKALSLAGLAFWCRIQGDAYGNEYSHEDGLYADPFNYETAATPFRTDVCHAMEEEMWKELPDYCYDGVCPLPWTLDDACSIRYGIVIHNVWRQDYLCYSPSAEPMYLHFGFLFSAVLLAQVVFGIYYSVKKHVVLHLKHKLFKKNGGLLLEHHIANCRGCTRVFTAAELEMEINCVKQNILLEEGQIESFINDIITLAHINHQNVLKFLGCCLEIEAPILVYEFASNGTLFEYIHDWKNGKIATPGMGVLIQIAAESAAGLAYLHSQSIMHGNVKSSNILLINGYAKIGGFGPPRLDVPTNESQMSTFVRDTLGYLDPDYLVTGQLTYKSDVYSFGVVLVEILTGKRPVCFNRPGNQRIIICHFLVSMEKQDGLFQILAPQVKENNIEQVTAVAVLAKKCLKLSSSDRPTMEEVARDLKRLSDMYHILQIN